jgi:leucyl-tRNA synthetase
MEIPIPAVIDPDDPADRPEDQAYTGHGKVVASGPYTGMRSDDMIVKVIQDLEATGKGKRRIHYRLRDWLVSRQRYWGAPIPIVHCERCGQVAVPVEDLPVELPYDVDFSLGAGTSPLERSRSFMETSCPSCGGAARRDPDTMDTFVDSSWYFLRYLSPDRDDVPWDRELADKWCPIYHYSGGIEHAVLHLLYSRFMIKALRDLGHLGFSEPFQRLVHQGTITNLGVRMSKSRGNVISPDDYVAEYGADAFRTYLMFGFSWFEGGDWKDEGIRAVAAWLQRVWRLVDRHKDLFAEGRELRSVDREEPAAKELELVRHRTVKAVTEDFERWEFNTAIARVMELVNALYQYAPIDPAPADPSSRVDEPLLAECVETLVKLIGPVAPHLAEEMWSMIGRQPSIADATWPDYDPRVLVTEEVTIVIQVNGKVREQMRAPRDLPKDEVEARALVHGRIPQLLDGTRPRRVVVVPNKLVNLVV